MAVGYVRGSGEHYLYVHNNPTNATDPYGLAAWRLDLHGHGGPHIQLGNLRWDAVTGEPLEHLGKMPLDLTPKQWEELRQAGIWDRIMKNVPDNRLGQVVADLLADEVREKLAQKGAKSLTKSAAKRVAKEVIRRSPLALFFLVPAAREARADAAERGIMFAATNQVFPAKLFEQVYSSAAHGVSGWIWDDLIDVPGQNRKRLQRFEDALDMRPRRRR